MITEQTGKALADIRRPSQDVSERAIQQDDGIYNTRLRCYFIQEGNEGSSLSS